MLRKIIAGILIILSSIMLGLSLAGIGLIWMYKQPLVQTSVFQLRSVDSEVGQAQTALQNAKAELERTLRIVEDAEISVAALKGQFDEVKTLFGSMNGTLDNQLLPGMKAAREKLVQAKSTLEGLRQTLNQLNSLPTMNLNLPGDQFLVELIASSSSLDAEIVLVEDLVKKASTFANDASYLMGFDFSETKNNLQTFLTVVQEYDQKLTGWRAQLAVLVGALPSWIETAAVGLTVFLLWFGFSQFSLILHGLSLWMGNDTRTKLRT
jgi:hypothetical protein